MKRQIIRQKNGMYAVFSLIINNIIYHSATREEIVSEYLLYPVKLKDKLNRKEIELLVDKQLGEADNNEAIRRALEACRATNGEREYKRVLNILNCK
jgi:hypothetical protein